MSTTTETQRLVIPQPPVALGEAVYLAGYDHRWGPHDELEPAVVTGICWRPSRYMPDGGYWQVALTIANDIRLGDWHDIEDIARRPWEPQGEVQS